MSSFERQFRRSISKEEILRPVGRILVAVSGSTSGLTASYVMEKVEKVFPDVELIFAHVSRWDDSEEEEVVGTFFRKHLTSGLTIFPMDELLTLSGFESFLRVDYTSGGPTCIICKSLTRRAILKVAKKVGASCAILGETLDEHLTGKIMGIWLRGRSQNLSSTLRTRPVHGVMLSMPFLFTTSRGVELYAKAKNLEHPEFICRYKDRASSTISRALTRIEGESTGMMFSFRGFVKSKEMSKA